MPTFNLTGHRALVTGGTQGVGGALSRAIAAAGADVVVHGLHDDDLARETIAECRGYGVDAQLVTADLMQPPADYLDALTRYDKLDLVVNNAGTCIDVPFLDFDYERFQRTMQLNVTAGYFITQAFARRWVDQDVQGRVLFTGSINGVLSEMDHSRVRHQQRCRSGNGANPGRRSSAAWYPRQRDRTGAGPHAVDGGAGRRTSLRSVDEIAYTEWSGPRSRGLWGRGGIPAFRCRRAHSGANAVDRWWHERLATTGSTGELAMKRSLGTFAMLVMGSVAAFADDASHTDALDGAVEFVRQHCVECHGADQPEAGLNLQDFSTTADVVGAIGRWNKIIDPRVQRPDAAAG